MSDAAPLPGTERLTREGDLAEQMVAGVDRFLLVELAAAVDRRAAHWQRDLDSQQAYAASIEPNRRRLAQRLGLVDARSPNPRLELVATPTQSAVLAESSGLRISAVRWEVLPGVQGEGLLLEPAGQPIRALVVAIGDCDDPPEALVGLVPGAPANRSWARRLAECGCRVVVPTLINRQHDLSAVADEERRSTVTHREFVYRAAFQMGRHLLGYEVHKVLAAVTALAADQDTDLPIGVIGYGQGGQLALLAAAVDTRVQAVGVSGYFDSRQELWREPLDRNVFGFLSEFGDAELLGLVAPRAAVIEACAGPEFTIPPGGESAPAVLTTPPPDRVRQEFARAQSLLANLSPPAPLSLVASGDGTDPSGSAEFLHEFLADLRLADIGAERLEPVTVPAWDGPVRLSDSAARHSRQFTELVDFSQRLVDGSGEVRAAWLAGIVRDQGLTAYSASLEPYREHLRDEIIGQFDQPLLPANAHTRLAYDEPEFRGYQVVLDVFDDVFLYGLLLVPKDLAAGERRAVVVCQHGLEGRAESTVEGDQTSYRGFAARLARRGFVTFAPQHLYRGGDGFRTLQRKANPLGKSLFAIMVAQHQQLLAWLGEQPFVDAGRIGFYGISYGGKSALRIPALVEGYCLSICSSDFSDWIWRTASNRLATGYLGHSEYEIFEFDLGNRFNYGDLAALICPRPFMVEDFHNSGMFAERTRAEYARVQLLYENLAIPDRTRLSYYSAFQPSSPYEERATFDFLEKHLAK